MSFLLTNERCLETDECLFIMQHLTLFCCILFASFHSISRTKMEPMTNCIHMACTEIRAENLSGECHWLRELG